ncbi:MAG: HEAT repeat domain-containing protein [Cyanobacteriota bacterium]|nr:HEAT repeat domain-containing protein [Cyanobacteriota bacterium]
MSIYREFDDLDIEQLVALFQKPPIFTKENARLYYLEIAYLIKEQGEAGIAFLQQELKRVEAADKVSAIAILFAPDCERPKEPAIWERLLGYLHYGEIACLVEERSAETIASLRPKFKRVEEVIDEARLAALLFALASARSRDLGMRERLRHYLQDTRSTVVLEAIEGLCALSDKDAVDRVLPLLKHPSPYVKGSVLRFMARLHPERAKPLLFEALKHPHFIVRESAADELGDLADVAAIPNLRPLLEDPHPYVRQAVETAIDCLEESHLKN